MKRIFRLHQGPKVFISYSFGNDLSHNLAEMLRAHGYRVTIVHDKMLLGTPSLKGALTELIQQAEVVIPVLDSRANSSNWVEIEINIATALKKPVIPIVQNDSGLSPTVTAIAYLNEKSPTLSATNASALFEAIEAFYFFMPFEPKSPFHFSDQPLQDFMASQPQSRSMIRLIIDPFGENEAALNAIGQFQSRLPDESLKKNAAASSEDVAMCIRRIDRLQELMCKYRNAIHLALGSYGGDLPLRSVTSWQRLLRYVVGSLWIGIGKRFSPKCLSDTFPNYALAVSEAVAESHAYEGDNSVCHDAAFTWAMQFRSQPKGPYNPAPGKGGWFWCGFAASIGKTFTGFLPATQRIVDGVKYAQRPATYVEDYEWADYGLPQLVAKGVVLADRFGDSTFTSQLVYDLRQYDRSYYPS